LPNICLANKMEVSLLITGIQCGQD
jgi:hypothetical protein